MNLKKGGQAGNYVNAIGQASSKTTVTSIASSDNSDNNSSYGKRDRATQRVAGRLPDDSLRPEKRTAEV